jgi:nitroimidazol reductase NimA-like FMN-containing flavoprotein (pyridoxamine 5'-phosphate oxidase superfamily)
MRLGLCRSGMPYVVPMNFGCEWEGDLPVLYAHCAHDGLKLDILRENSNVCVEMDSGGELIQGAKRRSHPNCAAHALRQSLRL